MFVLHLFYCSEPNEGDPSPYQGTEDNKNNRWRDVSMSVICTGVGGGDKYVKMKLKVTLNISTFRQLSDIENSNAAIPCLSNFKC